jgi:hypothetical protein
MRLTLRQVRKRPKQARPTGQARPSSMPSPVATALPPFQPSHTGQMWPARAARPAATTQPSLPEPPPWGSSRARASSTAAVPLSTSIRNTTRAGPLPTTRSTLVAPVEPEPSWRRSTPASQRPASQPAGIDPSR